MKRVIVNVRNKYSLLQSILPLDFLMKKDESNYSTIDKIVCVSRDLGNLCDSVVPIE